LPVTPCFESFPIIKAIGVIQRWKNDAIQDFSLPSFLLLLPLTCHFFPGRYSRDWIPSITPPFPPKSLNKSCEGFPERLAFLSNPIGGTDLIVHSPDLYFESSTRAMQIHFFLDCAMVFQSYHASLGASCRNHFPVCLFLLHIQWLERFDDLNPLFRYPPLSKFFSIPLYICFGLHEWTGRVMQIGFTFGMAFYLYRLAQFYGGDAAGKTAAILGVFLPPVFHYGNTTMIEGGTLFFITASFFTGYVLSNAKGNLI
jgi:hypothetical protein